MRLVFHARLSTTLFVDEYSLSLLAVTLLGLIDRPAHVGAMRAFDGGARVAVSLLGFLSHYGSAEVPAEGGHGRCTDRRRRPAGVLTAEGGRRRRRREGCVAPRRRRRKS